MQVQGNANSTGASGTGMAGQYAASSAQTSGARRPLPPKGVLIAGFVLSVGLALGLAMLAKPGELTNEMGGPLANKPAATAANAKPESNDPAAVAARVEANKQVLAQRETGGQAAVRTTGQAGGQASAQTAPAAGGKQPEAKGSPGAGEALPAPIVLGERVGKIDAAARSLETLVIVKDARSYLDAIAAWTPTRRFPVLIDDGSVLATDNIARFVRAFAPKSIVRWQAEDGATLQWGSVPVESMRESVNRAWDAKDGEVKTLVDAMVARGVLPPGIVIVAKQSDHAWTAGVALAAARGQPLFAMDLKNAVNGALSLAEADDLAAAIEAAAESTTLKWRSEGDDVDAVTIAAHVPVRMDVDGKEFLALTDRIGRLGKGKDASQRWAWCGQIFGDAPTAAYRAMSSIFVRPKQAFYFDGYENKAPYNLYDCTKASEIARQAGYSIEVFDIPSNGAKDWRSRASRAFDAGLVFVTTHGNVSEFNLTPGQATPGDLPLLGQPAIVHFVHSWSTLFAGNRDTLAGRWLERGSHFYVGSVHEPYLAAFLPTDVLNRRMLSGAALGAAVRVERPDIWKIAVLGDPLLTMQSASGKVEEELPLAGAKAIDANLRDDLIAKKFGEAFRVLAMQGRDSALAKLFAAAQQKEPATIDSTAAKWAVIALARSDDAEGLAAAFNAMNEQDAKEPILRDALWLVGSQRLAKPSDALLSAMRKNLRKESFARDAATLASAFERAKGAEASTNFVNEVRATLTEQSQRDELDAALKARVR